MQNLIASLVAAALALSVMLAGAEENSGAGRPIRMPQLKAAASIVRDTNHIAQIGLFIFV